MSRHIKWLLNDKNVFYKYEKNILLTCTNSGPKRSLCFSIYRDLRIKFDFFRRDGLKKKLAVAGESGFLETKHNENS